MKEKVMHDLTPDFTLVLNGGSKQMDDATIPVKWFFSKKIARQKPTLILIVELARGEQNSPDLGRRYVVKIEEAVKFIQLFRSGAHTILALAFQDKQAYKYLQQDNDGTYHRKIDPEAFKILESSTWSNAIAKTYVEFEVPPSLFAKKPETKLKKIWWNYLF